MNTTEHRPPRNWNHEPVDGGIAIGEGCSSFTRRVTLINPTAKAFHDGRSFVLWFGTCGATYLHVYANNLEDALDECVDWLAGHEPGHLADEEVADEYKRLLAEAVAGGASAEDEDVIERCQEQATVDTTCAGNAGNYLHSWEWGISLENPTTERLYAFIQGE